jgi:nucleotide-binding universal stress UspA family protein
MTPQMIVSYDDTANDQDALTLGTLFAEAGATLSLAYVRHTQPSEGRGDALEQDEAEALLERGAQSIGLPNAPRHVVVHASTGDGLRQLAERERADLIVFGSDYRTAPGSVRGGTSAQRLLAGGPAAVAIAPSGFRSRASVRIARIGVMAEPGDTAAEETARALAESLGASVVSPGNGSVDLLVVGSRTEAAEGRVMLSAVGEYAVEIATCPVLAIPRGVALRFSARNLATA